MKIKSESVACRLLRLFVGESILSWGKNAPKEYCSCFDDVAVGVAALLKLLYIFPSFTTTKELTSAISESQKNVQLEKKIDLIV